MLPAAFISGLSESIPVELLRFILGPNVLPLSVATQRKPSVLTCPRCNLVNASETKYCSSCSYPLIPSAFEEIKEAENMKIQTLQQKYEQEMNTMREQMNHIMLMIQQNPTLAQVKPEVLVNKNLPS